MKAKHAACGINAKHFLITPTVESKNMARVVDHTRYFLDWRIGGLGLSSAGVKKFLDSSERDEYELHNPRKSLIEKGLTLTISPSVNLIS